MNSPIEVFENLLKSVNHSDFIWMIFVASFSWILFNVTLKNTKNMKQDLKTVILDFSLLAVVVILFFIYGKMKISEKGVSGYLIMVFSSFLTFFSILISTRVNEKLLNYISKIVVLIFIIALIAPLLFNQISYSYAIQFGLLTGLFLGRITKNIILMFNK